MKETSGVTGDNKLNTQRWFLWSQEFGMDFQVCQVTREGNYSSELSTVSGALYLVIGASGKMQAEFGKSPGKQEKEASIA